MVTKNYVCQVCGYIIPLKQAMNDNKPPIHCGKPAIRDYGGIAIDASKGTRSGWSE